MPDTETEMTPATDRPDQSDLLVPGKGTSFDSAEFAALFEDLEMALEQRRDGLHTDTECFNFIADRLFRALEKLTDHPGPFERVALDEAGDGQDRR